MTWDIQASPRDATEPATSGADPRVLHPFRSLLTGSVVVAGPATADLVAAIRKTARSVTILDGQLGEARHDAVVLLDPPTPAWDATCGLLRPGGRLIVVVANALSLRRLAGPPETDGAPDPFDGALPTRRGLRDRLAGLGLTEQDWWFPFPDHRLALSLVAGRGLAADATFDPSVFAGDGAPFDPGGPGHGPFSIRSTWTGVARAGLLGELAPAFCVAASAAPLPEDRRLALHFGHRRRPAFDKVVSFARAGDAIRVTRAPLHPDLSRTVDGVTNRFPDEAFIPGATWQTGLQALLARDGWTVAGIVTWASVWRDAVRARYAGGADLNLGTSLPGDAVDAIPRNLLHRDGAPVFIDAEWEIEELGFGHLLVRGLINAFTDLEACGAPGPGVAPTLLALVLAVAEGLGLPLDVAALDEALARESRFQTTVSGRETRRNRAWLAATRLPLRGDPPDPFADRDRTIARLTGEVAALRAEGESRVAAVTEDLEESRRRTDRVIRYAAGLDRERGRLACALAEATGAGQVRFPPRAESRPWHGYPLLRRVTAVFGVVRTVLVTGFDRFASHRGSAER